MRVFQDERHVWLTVYPVFIEKVALLEHPSNMNAYIPPSSIKIKIDTLHHVPEATLKEIKAVGYSEKQGYALIFFLY